MNFDKTDAKLDEIDHELDKISLYSYKSIYTSDNSKVEQLLSVNQRSIILILILFQCGSSAVLRFLKTDLKLTSLI